MRKTTIRNILFLISFCLLTACPVSQKNLTYGKPSTKEERVKLRLTEFFELCEAGNLRETANYMVYRGDDETRRWKDVLNYDNPEERKKVEDLAGDISKLLSKGDEYAIVQYFTENDRKDVRRYCNRNFIYTGIKGLIIMVKPNHSCFTMT
ncbi:MAG: hypothetical protein B6D61_02295 [Bacteroidetes bacterium 4484_249]|nr:MAG: hypothetical protein B6D61_02295 [Bacteroidetes bacterium 4484_249]